jgi:hypothetical protein
MNWTEIIGYTGTVLIAVSLTMKNIVKLRWINLFGAATFATYGLITNALPVFILNGYITLVDIYYLIVLYKKKDEFSIYPIMPGNRYMKKFLEFYRDDIAKFFPDFSYDNLEGKKIFFVLRNLFPVGLFIYEEKGDGVAEIILDYAVPSYRDLNNAKFLMKTTPKFFKENGIHKLVAYSEVEQHVAYLKKIGFEKGEKPNEFVKKIS